MKGKKTGGIQKGFKYPKTVEFSARCDSLGFIVVEEMIKLFKSCHDPIMKLEILREMAKYNYAIPRDNGPEEELPDPESAGSISLSDILHAIDVTPKQIDVKKKP